MAIATVFILNSPRVHFIRVSSVERFACIYQQWIHREPTIFPPFLYLLDVLPYIIKVTTIYSFTIFNFSFVSFCLPFVCFMHRTTQCAKWTACDILTRCSQCFITFYVCWMLYYIWFTKLHLYKWVCFLSAVERGSAHQSSNISNSSNHSTS